MESLPRKKVLKYLMDVAPKLTIRYLVSICSYIIQLFYSIEMHHKKSFISEVRLS